MEENSIHYSFASLEVTVPASFDARPLGEDGERGVAFFRTAFDNPPPGARAVLEFEACSFFCRVFVDGHEVAESGRRPSGAAI